MASLIQQLRQLAAPQLNVLTGRPSRSSLLFHPRHAAGLDHESFYEIGISGLDALKQLNHRFAEFETSLFDSSALSLERAVQTAEVNQRLDAEVRKFFLMLQPYALLQPALKVLEWLVHRFNVELYSIDDLLMLALPYHDTPTFVKILQLVDLGDRFSRWHWLLPLQKPGLTLGRRDLTMQCKRDPGLLKLICDTTLAAVKLHGKRAAGGLATMLSFHAATLVGLVHYTGTVTETQMVHITKSLLRGLKSPVSDFTAGALMVTAQIAQNAQLGADFIATVVRVLILKGATRRLLEERAMLLVLLYQTQPEAPGSALLPIVNKPELVAAVVAISNRRVDVLPMILPLVTAALLEKKVASRAIDLAMSLHLVPAQARALADCALAACDVDPAKCSHYGKLLSALERQYPVEMDAAIAAALAALPKDKADALRATLCREETSSFVQVHHANPGRRAEALVRLSSLKVVSDKDSSSLAVALSERLRDDASVVVLAALRFSAAQMTRFLGAEPATDQLLALLSRCLAERGPWLAVAAQVVKTLADMPTVPAPARMLVHLLPHLMPADVPQTQLATAVLASPLVAQNAFLQSAAAEAGVKPTAEDVCAAVQGALRNVKRLLPPPEDFQQLLESECTTPSLTLSAMLLLTAALPEKLPLAQANALAATVLAATTRFGVRSVKPLKDDAGGGGLDLAECGAVASKRNVFPLPVLMLALASILHRSPPPDARAPFWLLNQPASDGALDIRCLGALLTGSCHHYASVQAHYATALGDFLRLRYPEPGHRIELLLQAAVAETGPLVTPHLKVRCLRLAAVLLPTGGRSRLSRWAPACLLAAASSPQAVGRGAAIDCARAAVARSNAADAELLRRLARRGEEVTLDAAQVAIAMKHALSPDAKVQKQLQPAEKSNLSSARDSLFAVASAASTPSYLVASLLSALAEVVSPTLLAALAPLGHGLLDRGVTLPCQEEALAALLARYTVDVAQYLKDRGGASWVLLERYIRHLIFLPSGTCTSERAMAALGKELLAALDSETLDRLVSLLVEVVADADHPGISAAASKLVKRMLLPAELIAKHLTTMSKATEQSTTPGSRRKSRFVASVPSPSVVSCSEWRRGVAILELTQNKKRVKEPALLLQSLFAVLAKCLQFEQQAPVEYPKQLVLQCVLQCCQRISPAQAAGTGLNVELVVECIRASQNPQTHHHALLVLAQVAAMAPQQVLHNVMSIFTFMGSSVLRQDDAYSVQVITKIVDTIVPILINAEVAGPDVSANLRPPTGCGVLRVFVDALPGIPAHRVTPLFQRLLAALGAEDALWSLLALLLEAQVIRPADQMQLGLALVQLEPPISTINAATHLTAYLLALPSDREAVQRKADRKVTAELFDVKTHTEKQLRHFKFLLVQQIGALLSLPELAERIAGARLKPMQLQEVYGTLLERLLVLVQRWLQQVSASADLPTGKYWRVMLTLTLDVLDKVNGLLPTSVFFGVITGLLTHPQAVLQRKAMELLNARLQKQVYLNELKPENVLSLMPHIIKIVATILEPDAEAASAETELCQQTALLSVKMLAHRMAAEFPAPFKEALPLITRLACAKLPHGNLQAAVVLCLAELCAVLNKKAVSHLPLFMPALIELLDQQALLESPDLATLSIVTALDKISEALASFQSPYLSALLRSYALASARWQPLASHRRVAPTLARLAAARGRLAAAVEPRIVVPAVARCYRQLVDEREFDAIAPLLKALTSTVQCLEGVALQQQLPALTAFFLDALDLRASGMVGISAREVELHVISTLVKLVLKLSEEAFRPLYIQLYHWASEEGAPLERSITFYRLSANIACSLKGLFALFATRSVSHAASTLARLEKTPCPELAEYVLDSLYQAVTHGGAHFVTTERFNALLQPIVNQLEAATTEDGEDRANRLVGPCLANMASASGDDVLWKQLNYQVLLKTRDPRPKVRMAALSALCLVATKIGEDFLPLLPETIPFLAELLEDEEEVVERAAQAAMRELQTVLGEPLDKYL